MAMMFGYCPLSLVPLRLTPSHRSEMVNQMLFGEWFEIESEAAEWLQIRLLHDGYAAYVERQAVILTDVLPDTEGREYVVGSRIMRLCNRSGIFPAVDVIQGTRLKGISPFSFIVHNQQYESDIPAQVLPAAVDKERLILRACCWIGVPYLWGGRSIFGVDCSGFIQQLFRMEGLDLPRDAWQQAQCGISTAGPDAAAAGDLAFFGSGEKVSHVGLLLTGNTIIHASGQVKISLVDETGILADDGRSYSHKLLFINRL